MEPHSFIVDLESLSNGLETDLTPNSTMKLKRTISRKGALNGGGGGEKRIFPSHVIDRDTPIVSVSISPPVAATPPANDDDGAIEKPTRMALAEATAEQPTKQIPQHQITIRTTNISTMVDGNKLMSKKHSSRRSPWSLFLDPRRIVLFFATLSSVGTMLLIFFTLTMSKPKEYDVFLD